MHACHAASIARSPIPSHDNCAELVVLLRGARKTRIQGTDRRGFLQDTGTTNWFDTGVQVIQITNSMHKQVADQRLCLLTLSWVSASRLTRSHGAGTGTGR